MIDSRGNAKGHLHRIFGPSVVAIALLATLVPGAEAKKKGLPGVQVACGETITRSVRLENSLSCLTGDGLIVGAGKITLDLGGHRILGANGAGTAGVRNDGFDKVKIRNGVVQRFENGVVVHNVRKNVISGLMVARSVQGGIVLSSSSGNVVRRNTTTRILSAESDPPGGIILHASHGNKIVRNDSSLNFGHGILLVSSDENRVGRNTTTFNGGSGIWLQASDLNRVSRNRSISNTEGLWLSSSEKNRVRSNSTTANTLNGIRLDSSNDNVLKKNGSSNNRDNGIRVDDQSTGNLVVKNAAHENGENGIVSGDADATIRSNKAHRNGFFDGESDGFGLGIAAEEATAGGKNKAKDNDDPAGCEPLELCT